MLSREVVKKHGTSVGVVAFTFREPGAQGDLVIRNRCEVVIRKASYLNVCAAAPESRWDEKQAAILSVFASWMMP